MMSKEYSVSATQYVHVQCHLQQTFTFNILIIKYVHYQLQRKVTKGWSTQHTHHTNKYNYMVDKTFTLISCSQDKYIQHIHVWMVI